VATSGHIIFIYEAKQSEITRIVTQMEGSLLLSEQCVDRS